MRRRRKVMMGRVDEIVDLKPRLRRVDWAAHRRAAIEIGLDNEN
jgi:hypothetical protein